jgi:alpha-tubulin suppressor-like RCC1 family protein
VTYGSCGEKHSVVVTLEGGVFSFGSSVHGQLGHNSTNDELLPRKISELMGSEVSQIACGRYFASDKYLKRGFLLPPPLKLLTSGQP